jgi:hypothetical protein
MTTTINASTSSGLVNTADTSGILQLQTASTAAVTIDASQRVGIGTTAPNKPLSVYGGDGYVQMLNASTGTGNTDGAFIGVEGGTTALRVVNQENDVISFSTNGLANERMRIDSSGNVGIGTSSPSSKLDVSGVVSLQGTTLPSAGTARLFSRSSDSSFYMQSATGGSINLLDGSQNSMGLFGSSLVQFFTGNTERMRVASDGTVRIGTTSDIGGKLSVDCTTGNSFGAIVKSNTSGGAALAVNAENPCSTHVQWYNSGTPTGTVTWNGASAVAYNTTSDYRLKENIAPMTGALAKVVQLKPVTYKWKLDGADGQGFIAHELQAIVPDCVSGDKDATREEQYEVTPAVEDEEGNITTPAVMGTRTVPVYQGIDTSFLVATLTAAIQELKAINDTQAETINALTARIVALEK